jgi:hypothetical protein
MDELRLDASGAAGTLGEVFSFEATTVEHRCGGCGGPAGSGGDGIRGEKILAESFAAQAARTP